MTVSLSSLIEEWDAINRDLYKASLESHRRYPFPSHLFHPDAPATHLTSSSDLPGSPTGAASPTDSSTAAYARVYELVARVRYIAEDARYNSFHILQHLIWVTLVGWANQLAVASGGVVRLPAAVQQRGTQASPSTAHEDPADTCTSSSSRERDTAAAATAASPRASQQSVFPCSLLSPLTFWDPNVLAEAAGAETPTRGTTHRAPNLPVVWAEAVQRIVTLWCTPTTTAASSSSNHLSDAAAGAPAARRNATGSGSHLHEAYTWVLIAQHYHRFKAILSLFFLRYDAHLEELEEQQRRLGHCHVPPPPPLPSSSSHGAEAGEAVGGVAVAFPFTQTPRRRGPHLRVPSDVSAASFAPSAARPTNPGATASTSSNNNNNNSRSLLPSEAERAAGSRAATSSRSAAATPHPTTARLLALMMRSIETENIHAITVATGEAVLFLLMPPVHRARLRERVVKARQQQHQHQQLRENPLTEPECMASAFLDGCAAEEEDEDDDKVVWSAPPSPLLSFDKFATLPPGVTLTPPDECLSLNDGESGAAQQRAVAHVSPVVERAQREEYVIRNVFKVLLMTEDCRVYALQHWLVEAGKHVVAVYGAQLASLFFEDSGVASSAGTAPGKECGEKRSEAEPPALTVHTLADANRVLRETIQSYVRLRTKLLFLNAGTTHFLEALTPWGRTRMLENLNAFLCGFCGVTLPMSPAGPTEAAAAAAEGSSTAAAAATPNANDATQYFTPTNAAVAAFARTWAVPLWLAMCDDAQHRLESLQAAKQRREDKKKEGTSLTERPRPGPLESVQRALQLRDASKRGESRSREVSESPRSPMNARSPSYSGKFKKEPAEGEFTLAAAAAAASVRSPTDGQETSIASADLGDAVSQAPSSPTAGGVSRHGNSVVTVGGVGGLGAPDFARARSRGVDLRRVLQQHQRQRVPFEPLPQRVGVDPVGGRGVALQNGGDDGGLEESLYSAETASMGDASPFSAAAAAIPRNNSRDDVNNGNGRGPGANGSAMEGGGVYPDTNGAGPIVPANSVEAAVAAARHRRRQAAAAAAQEQRTILGAPGTTQRFSRAAQLHQVATLPDEGFPSLMYLMPRRSRFIAQDKAAASMQQELFTRFSSDVHRYLTTYLAESEAAAAEEKAEAHHDTTTAAADTAAKTKPAAAKAKATKTKKREPVVDGDVRPLPQSVLTRMIFLLDMTYAALQGSGVVDSHHGHTNGPLMESGLTATGQELGAAILEQDNGEFESVVSTTLSAPTSPAVLTIAAVRKGFQGFLAAQEKRAVLTLAQALYRLIQQGIARQPPSVSLESVDTILNMASLLNSKDMFVSLMKGYIAPQVLLCRSINDAAVESQVVARMAYRLGSAVAAPCITLLRDLRLAMSDALNPTHEGDTANTSGGPLSLLHDSVRDDDGSPAYFANDNSGMTAAGAQLVATRDAQTLAAAAPLRHGLFGLIHRIRVLCQAWWQPHTAAILSSRRLQRLWERYQLLDERIVDAVLRVEWRYDGHTEPFHGYGRLVGDGTDADGRSGEGAYTNDGRHLRSSVSDSGLSGGTHRQQQQQQQQEQQQRGTHASAPRGSMRGSASATAVNVRRGGAAAAVIQGFSSVLGNAVRRTGHHAGAFGNNESDNESEDYSEAYGGLLTLNTLQRHRGAYTASNSSYRGSNVSSVGGGGGGHYNGDYWDASDGGQSAAADEVASSTVPPNGVRERRQLRWPLGDGQLVFLLHSKKTSPPSQATTASQAVQVSGPPLTLLVCQLLDRAPPSTPHTFDKLYKALPVQAPKPLLAHLLHELVKAGVVTRSIPAGTRQYAYQLRDDVQYVHQRKVVLDVRAAAQQHWVTRTLTAAESDTEQASQRDPMSPASPTALNASFSASAGRGGRAPSSAAPRGETASDDAMGVQRGGETTASSSTLATASASTAGVTAAAALADQASPAYSAERIHKIKVCIVRIMKAERVLSHRELLERVAAALEDQFVVTSGQFKRCVAHLIEKEFLQRSEGGEEYMYLT